MISIVSPRTRNLPREKSTSLRSYCMSTNRRMSLSRPTCSPDLERDHGLQVLLGRAEAVDARDGGDDDDVAPAEQRVGRGVPQPLDLGVDRRVLLDEGVGLRDVGLGLVVVVVGDEVLDRVVRQELAELVGELRGQRLVVREHQGRPLHLLDEPGGRGGLAGAGGAEEHDIRLAGVDAGGEFGDGLRLIAARRVLADDLERTDGARGLHASSLGSTTDIGAGVRSGRNPRAGSGGAAAPTAHPSARASARGVPSVSITTSATAQALVVGGLRADAALGLGARPSRAAHQPFDPGLGRRVRDDDRSNGYALADSTSNGTS